MYSNRLDALTQYVHSLTSGNAHSIPLYTIYEWTCQRSDAMHHKGEIRDGHSSKWKLISLPLSPLSLFVEANGN